MLRYYILEAAILGKFSHVFIMLMDGAACAQAAAKVVSRGWAQSCPNFSCGTRSLLTWVCRASLSDSARDSRQDTAASLRSLNREKGNN